MTMVLVAAAHSASAQTAQSWPDASAPIMDSAAQDSAAQANATQNSADMPCAASAPAAAPLPEEAPSQAPNATSPDALASDAQENEATGCVVLPPPPVRPAAPDLFGTVALPVSATSLDARWAAARPSPLPAGPVPLETGLADAAMAAAQPRPWDDLLTDLAGRDERTRLQQVNNWVNRRIRFTDDSFADHWSPLAETIARGSGDCEDFVIAKMALLEMAGLNTDNMYLVIVRDQYRRADHAVLAIHLDGQWLVLDNRTDQILPAEAISDYRPVLSYSGPFAWTHGYRSGIIAAAQENWGSGIAR